MIHFMKPQLRTVRRQSQQEYVRKCLLTRCQYNANVIWYCIAAFPYFGSFQSVPANKHIDTEHIFSHRLGCKTQFRHQPQTANCLAYLSIENIVPILAMSIRSCFIYGDLLYISLLPRYMYYYYLHINILHTYMDRCVSFIVFITWEICYNCRCSKRTANKKNITFTKFSFVYLSLSISEWSVVNHLSRLWLWINYGCSTNVFARYPIIGAIILIWI